MDNYGFELLKLKDTIFFLRIILLQAFYLRKLLGIGRKHRVDIYIGTREFKKQNHDELEVAPGDLFFLDDKIYDPVVANDGKIVGWYKAKRFKDDDDRPVY